MKKLLLCALIGFTPCIQPMPVSPSKAIAGLTVAASACKLTHCLYTKYTLNKQIKIMRDQLRTTQLKGNDRLNLIKQLNAFIVRSNKNDITAWISLAACGAGSYYLFSSSQPRRPRGNNGRRPAFVPHNDNDDINQIAADLLRQQEDDNLRRERANENNNVTILEAVKAEAQRRHNSQLALHSLSNDAKKNLRNAVKRLSEENISDENIHTIECPICFNTPANTDSFFNFWTQCPRDNNQSHAICVQCRGIIEHQNSADNAKCPTCQVLFKP